VRFAVFACVLLWAVRGFADTPQERARKLFEEGRELAKVANFTEACDRFAKSFELDPAPGTVVNFADCQEHLGHLSRAWELFEQAASRADHESNAVRAQYARDRLTALKPRLGELVVRIADPRLDRITVTIGGRDVKPAAELHTRVDPGDTEVIVVAPERRFSQTAHTAAGAQTTIDVPRLGRDAARRDRTWVLAAGGAAGLGVIGLATSGVFALSAVRYYNDAYTHGECFYTIRGDECTAPGLARVDSAHARANASTGFFVGGLALVATSILVYTFAPREHAIEVVPAVTPEATSVSIAGRF